MTQPNPGLIVGSSFLDQELASRLKLTFGGIKCRGTATLLQHLYLYYYKTNTQAILTLVAVSKSTSQALLFLDGLEEPFEGALAKAVMVMSLDDFNEQGWSVMVWLGEDL